MALKIIKCPWCGKEARITYEENRVYQMKCYSCRNTMLHVDHSFDSAVDFFEHHANLLKAEKDGRLMVLPETLKRAIIRKDYRCFSDFTMDDINNLLEAWDSGRLVVLPCKVGDTVYVINRRLNRIFECTVISISVGRSTDLKNYVKTQWVGPNGNESIRKWSLRQVGKYVFLTREEAEAALSKANTIPCKHGISRHRNEIGEDEVYCELNAKWMNVSLGECLGNCESETALKGGDGYETDFV